MHQTLRRRAAPPRIPAATKISARADIAAAVEAGAGPAAIEGTIGVPVTRRGNEVKADRHPPKAAKIAAKVSMAASVVVVVVAAAVAIAAKVAAEGIAEIAVPVRKASRAAAQFNQSVN
jgi:hypothetical protein